MSLIVKSPNENELVFRHNAQEEAVLFGFVIFASLFVVLIIARDFGNAFFVVFIIAFFGYSLWNRRKVEVTLDKRAGIIHSKRGGFLGTNWDTKELTRDTSEIERCEIKRFAGRGYDKYKIRLVIKSQSSPSDEIYLTNDLDFSEAHQYAEQIHQFLGKEIPLKTVD